jgi:hypothetical protein
MIVVVAIHRESLRTLVSAHGMLHVAVARQFIDGLNIPPDNPFAAGAPLPYYWVYHFTGAMAARLLNVHPLVGFELMVLASALALWLAAGSIGRRIAGRPAHGVWIALIALCGAQALGAWVFLGKLAIGAAAIPPDGGGYLWGLVHPMVRASRFSDPTSLYGPLVFFFINVTSRPIALSLLLVLAACLLAWLQDGSKKAVTGLVVSTAACTAFSPIIGIAAGLSLAGGLWTTWLFSRLTFAARLVSPGWSLRTVSVASAAIVGGIALAAPTFLMLAESGEVTIGLSRAAAIAAVTALLLPALLSLVGFWKSDAALRGYLIAVACACSALLVACVVISLPSMNSTNFFHAAALLLAIPAGAGLLLATRYRLLAMTLAAIAMVPPTAIVVRGFMNRPAVHLTMDGARLIRIPESNEYAALYQWLQRETPLNAVVLLDPTDDVVTAVGNAPELPALTGRALFISDSPTYIVDPFPGTPRRLEVATRLSRGEAPTDDDRGLLATLQRPVVLVTQRAHDAALLERLTLHHGSPLFQQGSLAAFRLTN